MAAKPSRKTTAKSQPSDAELEQKVIDAAMRLAALQGWSDTTMSDIADDAGIKVATVRRLFGHKLAIVAALFRQVDEAMLTGMDSGIADEPVKDRLFDLIMRRLDAMEPYRDGISAVMKSLRRDPAAAAWLLACPVRRSLEWALDGARVPSWGPLEPLQIKGLGLVMMAVMRVWIDDDSEDKGPTMAALDKALSRADSVASLLRRGPRFRRRRRADDEAEESAHAEAERSDTST